MRKRLVCEKVGGAPQYIVTAPEFMKLLLELDPALWAATNAPCESLNFDPKFIAYLDPNNSGSIRIDEVIDAIKFMLDSFKSENDLNKVASSICISELSAENENDDAYIEFVKKRFALGEDAEEVTLAQVSTKIEELTSGPLKGDGNIAIEALKTSEDKDLFKDITVINGKDKIDGEMLDKFLADAQDFLQWEENTAKPELKVKDPVLAYSAYTSLKSKIDEFFSFCQLVAVDSANVNRFKIDPEKMQPLDVLNPQSVSDYLDKAPLAFPSADLKLNLNSGINSKYLSRVRDFASAFKLSSMTLDKWEGIKQELAPYEEYCARIYGDATGKLGREKLEAYLAGKEIKHLRSVLAKDSELSNTLDKLRKLEKMILLRFHMPEFINNYVNFKDLYTPARTSMIQAGTLIIDGKHFDLSIWVKTPALHKKFALKSNLCMIYYELQSKTSGQAKQYAVSAVTSGSVNNLYIGKRGIFIDKSGKYWDAVLTDLVNGPISFWQTMLLPFRKAGEAVSQRMTKLASFNAIEQNLNKGIKNAQTQKKDSLLSAGSIAVLCGSVGVAALGSGLAFAINKLKDVSFIKILLVLLGIILLVMTPAVISALLKLRRRNLALFLEAAGWAVNQHLKLKSAIASSFTYSPGENDKKGGGWILFLALLVAVASIVIFLNQRYGWF